jgi:hypothetical protein
MSVSLYDASIPALTHGLTNLLGILEKGAQHAAAKKTDGKAYTAARLIADMHPLSRQVQIACDTSKGAAARLAGVEAPKHEDTETTFEELKARVQKTLDYLASLPPAKFAGDVQREIVLSFPSMTWKFTALDYVRTFVLPNFYFHVTMVYAVLRANGVDVGKGDFLGKIQ